MPKRTPVLVLTAALVAAFAPLLAAQSVSFEVEAGVQMVDVDGNEDMYRSQIDEDDGFVLGNLALAAFDTTGENGAFDRLRIDASGFGGSPDGRFRLQASLAEKYELNLSYQRMEQFSALPGFANPMLDDGIIPGQHTTERLREMTDLDIRILPGKMLSPIFGYTRSRYSGPSRTTVHAGDDEYELHSDLSRTEEEFRLGVAFHSGGWTGSVVQGWRDVSLSESFELVPGAGAGNNDRPVLGEDIYADDYNRSTSVDASAPVTTAYVTGRVSDRVRVEGSFVRSDYERDIAESESYSGTGVSFALRRFFHGFDSTVDASADGPAWRGDVHVSADVTDDVTVEAGYSGRHRSADGWALISELYLDTVNFSNADPRDVENLVTVSNAMEREENVFDVSVTAKNLGPWRVWAGYSLADQDVDLNESAAEIVVPGGQGGDFERSIDRFTVGGAVDAGPATLLLDFRQESADDPIVRTDFTDRQRWRLRARVPFNQYVHLLATYESISADNSDEGIGYDADTDHWSAALDLMPVEDLTVRLSYDSYETESKLTYRVPATFEVVPSLYLDETDVFEASAMYSVGRFDLDAGISQLENDGQLPLELDRIFARVAYEITERLGAAIEFDSWDYSEALLPLADFKADRIAFFVSWRQ